MPRIFYRHIAELSEDAVLTGQAAASVVADALEDADSTRVFKFGAATQVRRRASGVRGPPRRSLPTPPAANQADFDRWSRCFRTAIDALGVRAKAGVKTAQALETATNAGDLFRAAIASPKDRPQRRTQGGVVSLLHRGEVAVGSGAGCSVSRSACVHAPHEPLTTAADATAARHRAARRDQDRRGCGGRCAYARG